MAIQLNHSELEQLFSKLSDTYTVMAPVAQPDGGRFADMDNIVYQKNEEAQVAQRIYWSEDVTATDINMVNATA
jgi:hypothetical protein